MGKLTKTDLELMRSAYRKELESAVERLKAQLAELPEVRLVVLFGSYSAGRQDLFSDLDLLVVMDSDLDFVTRSARLYQRLRPGVDLDLIVYSLYSAGVQGDEWQGFCAPGPGGREDPL